MVNVQEKDDLSVGAAGTWDATKRCVLSRQTLASTFLSPRAQILRQYLDSRGPTRSPLR